MKEIYLDNAATTSLSENVYRAMEKYEIENYANPSAIYRVARESKSAVEESRKKIANALGVSSSEIYFTSGGTEADNWAIVGIAEGHIHKGNHIITSKVEHKAILNTCKYLESRGFEITYLDVDRNGRIDLEQLESSIKDNTILISIMTANNEVGTIMPINEISKIAHKYNVLFHTDAVQAFGHIPIDIKRVDLLSASAHKIHGAKGIGLLYIKEGTYIKSFIHGGAQEKGFRAGTENVPAIISMGVAVEEAFNKIYNKNNMIKLRDYLIERITSEIPGSHLTGDDKLRLPNNASFCFEDIEGVVLVDQLSKYSIYASSGSACNSEILEPSYVLQAIGIPLELSKGSLRITFSENTAKGELDFTIDKIKQIIGELRAV
ncbi:cysteine desulfurase family protein [Clostridium sp.]|uniref:cysteine desulfurase family protein n=1 Tax=Clostridium sp. TaxID=1506 RepID=UPI002FDCFCBE